MKRRATGVNEIRQQDSVLILFGIFLGQIWCGVQADPKSSSHGRTPVQTSKSDAAADQLDRGPYQSLVAFEMG